MTEKPLELARHWPLVLVCAIGIGLGVASLPFYTQGLFIEAWVKDFQWSRAEASLGILASTLALAAVSPFVGVAVDRYGLVKPVAFALGGLALSFVMFSLFVDSIASFVIISITMAILAGASSPLAYTRAINAVFDRQRGLALGLALSGTGIAAAIAPPLVGDAIAAFGWRITYQIMAGFTLVMGIAIICVLARLDGTRAPEAVQSDAAAAVFRTSLKHRAYWMLMVAIFLLALGISGLIVHFVPMLVELGLNLSDAAGIAGIIGIAVIAGRLTVGALVDRIFAPFVAAAAISLCLCGVLAMALAGSAAAIPAAMAIGFAIGAEVDLIGYLVARYFGMLAYGRLYGPQYSVFLIGTGLSPVLIGAVRDMTGSYQNALMVASAVLVASALLFVLLPQFPSNTPEGE